MQETTVQAKRRRRRLHLGLVARFALASLVVFVVIAIAMSFVASREMSRRAEHSAELRAVVVAQEVFRFALDDSGIKGTVHKPIRGLRYGHLDALVTSRILQTPVVRVKLWSPSGVILYSDDRRLVGRRFRGDPDARALHGETVSGVSDLSEPENVFERSLAPRLFSTYVPLYLASAPPGPPDAVVELYQDYSSIQAEANAVFRELLVSFSGALLVLYVALLPLVLRASRELRAQNDQLDWQARRLEGLLTVEQRSTAELRRLNKMQSDFAAVASHELRTPLTAILGYVKTLQRPEFEDDPVARSEFLGAIERQSGRLFRLITNLLTAAHVEHHGTALEVTSIRLATLVDEVVEGFHESSERLVVQLPPDLPTIYSDPMLVSGILNNLIDNGLKYSSDDAPVVIEASSDGGWMRISVRDSGVGVAPEEHRRIFDRFYQSDQSATRRFGGVGLGLPLVRELARTLGGTVEVESEPGVGSVFTVSLPLRPSQPSATRPGGHERVSARS
jgi:signal transduction histidine kinase